MQIEGPVQVARRSDMDMNGHINNVTYLGWALETVPADVYLNYSLHEVLPFWLWHATFMYAACFLHTMLQLSLRRQQHMMHCVQVEIDYKSECMAGQTVESLGSHVDEDANGSGMLRSGCLLPKACISAAIFTDTHSFFSMVIAIVSY